MVLNRSWSCGGFAGGTSLINLVVDTHLFDWMRLWCVHSLYYCFPLRLFFSQMWTTRQGKESSSQWTTVMKTMERGRRSELLALLQSRRNQLWLIYEQYLIYLLPLWRMLRDPMTQCRLCRRWTLTERLTDCQCQCQVMASNRVFFSWIPELLIHHSIHPFIHSIFILWH